MIYESDADGNLTPVREYTTEYRRQIESDIADAAVDYIKRQAAAGTPFFLYVGWTHTHYPSLTAPEFTGKSTHRYGDAMMELDHRTGQVLQAIEDAGDRGRHHRPVAERQRRLAGRGAMAGQGR